MLPPFGIALFMDFFDTDKLMAKYLTGEIGGYVPSHPISKMYVYNEIYKNDTPILVRPEAIISVKSTTTAYRCCFILFAIQIPSIAAGVIPKVTQSKRAIFSVGSALPET